MPAKSNYVPVHSNLRDHPKFYAFMDALDWPDHYSAEVQSHVAQSVLTCFWNWVLREFPDGKLSGVHARAMARGAEWIGTADGFLNAMIDAGFIDDDGNGNVVVHRWMEYAGRVETKRANARGRKQRERETEHVTPQKPNVTRDNGDIARDISTNKIRLNKTPESDSEQEVTDVTQENTAQCAGDERCTQPVPVGDTICKPHKIMQDYKESKEQSEIENEPQSPVNPDHGA